MTIKEKKFSAQEQQLERLHGYEEGKKKVEG
jgi:hypothetical protein